jgi:uncharacterized glyoxalase superfamily protein PhnB
MIAIDPRAEGMPWMSRYLIVQDVDKALSFCECAFGFQVGETMKGDDGNTVHGAMQFHDQIIMFGREGSDDKPMRSPSTTGVTSPVSLYFYVEDVDAAYRRAVDAGAEVWYEPADMHWGDRMATVVDPDGYAWSIATHKPSSKQEQQQSRQQPTEPQASDVGR